MLWVFALPYKSARSVLGRKNGNAVIVVGHEYKRARRSQLPILACRHHEVSNAGCADAFW